MTEDNTDEEVRVTEPLRAELKEAPLLGISMRAHRASWRLGGAPRFFEECFEIGIDVDSFKKLDDLYKEFVRMETCLRRSR